ncbi:MAG: gliding motility lipoprotein GldB [Flavobacteriaceae bacterium]|nr:gliding motility lipoprotein GldB [Flavobacteriaceae bacterium]
MTRIVGFLLMIVLFFGCEDDQKKIIDVSNINVNITVDRFEQKFYKTSEKNFKELKKDYAFMLSNADDSVWLNKIKSEDERYLFKESERIFSNFSDVKQNLKNLFKHIKYYNPKFKSPKVITHISDLDFEYPVIYSDSLLFISLDMYLGKDNIVYRSFPSYLSENYKKDRIVVDVAKDIINQSYQKSKNRTFLYRMINEGRIIYLIDSYLPAISDDLKIGYSKERLVFAEQNEMDIWKYFIEKELLYSNDKNLNKRFIDNAPFSKFYLESDQETPGRIGVWIGWQIVQSYMKNNDVTLQQLLVEKPEEIYKKSKYKPRR